MKYLIRKLPLADLSIDLSVQRRLAPSRVRRLADEFDPSALGVVTVSRRSDLNVVIDGQHRVEAARKIGYASPIECKVYEGLSRAEEARMFRELNNTQRVGVQDLMKVRFVEGEPVAAMIEKTIAAHGWTIGFGRGKGERVISAAGALDQVARLDPEGDRRILDRTISIITAAWGHASIGMQAPILSGLGKVIDRYGMDVDDSALIRILSRCTPDQALGFANAWRTTFQTKADTVAHWLVTEYNKKRTTNRLALWS